MSKWMITYEHTEGDGVNTVATGRKSGVYCEAVDAESLRDAVGNFEACHRHGDRMIGIEEA